MRTAYCGLAIWLFCSIPSFADAQGTAEFKPGDTITLTVKFAKKLPPNSTVRLEYQIQTPPTNDPCHGGGLNWSANTSTDNETFELTAKVPDNIASGSYIFQTLYVSNPNPDLAGNASRDTTKPPIIVVENKTPCPTRIDIPSFTITVKPKP